VAGGVDHGPVRRPLPSANALDDVLLAYEMNGEQLPYDHSYPARGLTPTPRDLGIPAQPCLSYAP
jgi:DMSO/TMAO reductase YedYZ molybdopterin-dependent catalytic subunit